MFITFILSNFGAAKCQSGKFIKPLHFVMNQNVTKKLNLNISYISEISAMNVIASNYFSSTSGCSRKCKIQHQVHSDVGNVNNVTSSPKESLITEQETPMLHTPKKRKKKAIALDPTELLNAGFGDDSYSFGLERLTSNYYDVPCEELAKSLLGKVLVRRLDDGTLLKGRIVETECYLGGIDKASHSYNGKITERTKPMYMKPGTCYVYFTYGMYHCFNISSKGPGAAVLLRALEPMLGLDYMQEQRGKKRKNNTVNATNEREHKKPKLLKPHELCNGPAKLCMCLCIDVSHCNMKRLFGWDGMWVEVDDLSKKVKPYHIITSTRIGIDSVGVEWASKPLRFYLFGSNSVSRVDKVKERELQQLCGLLP